MNRIPSIEFFIKNLPLRRTCFNTTLTPFQQAEVGKTETPFVSGKMGCPQCSPQPISRGVTAPNLQLASHQGKTVFTMYCHTGHCYGFLGETENLSQQPEIHGNLGLPTIHIILLQSSLSGIT